MYKLKYYFKPENKTNSSDFTKVGIKISPLKDLQELPSKGTLCIPLGWLRT